MKKDDLQRMIQGLKRKDNLQPEKSKQGGILERLNNCKKQNEILDKIFW